MCCNWICCLPVGSPSGPTHFCFLFQCTLTADTHFYSKDLFPFAHWCLWQTAGNKTHFCWLLCLQLQSKNISRFCHQCCWCCCCCSVLLGCHCFLGLRHHHFNFHCCRCSNCCSHYLQFLICHCCCCHHLCSHLHSDPSFPICNIWLLLQEGSFFHFCLFQCGHLWKQFQHQPSCFSFPLVCDLFHWPSDVRHLWVTLGIDMHPLCDCSSTPPVTCCVSFHWIPSWMPISRTFPLFFLLLLTSCHGCGVLICFQLSTLCVTFQQHFTFTDASVRAFTNHGFVGEFIQAIHVVHVCLLMAQWHIFSALKMDLHGHFWSSNLHTVNFISLSGTI